MEHLLILLVAGLFILGPEQLPETVRWLAESARKVRTFAATVHEQVQDELGPELTQLRKPLQDLRTLRSFDAGFGEDLSRAGTVVAAECQRGLDVTPLRPGERAPVDPDAT
nr:Sec-independent protein translocase TatB [Amycolatopsis sp. SID8362]